MTTPGVILPDAFKSRMSQLLAADFKDFLASFERPRTRGLRLNPAKTTADELSDMLGIPLTPVPWCPTGYVFPSDRSLGGHPAHVAGLFYLQEPSSMSPVEALNLQPDWSVIDLTASPGGKTTQLAGLISDDGLVVANEFVGSRLRPLHFNLDAWGARNVVTVSRDLRQLVDQAGTYDGALLDAPCSGEGLFRRNPAAVREWSESMIKGSARRQGQLLSTAARLVRPGGVLVYSTCTFELEENEQQIADFLAGASGWALADCRFCQDFSPGHSLPQAPTERTARLWPHRVEGEGQFIARLIRDDREAPPEPRTKNRAKDKRRRKKPGNDRSNTARILKSWKEFHQRVIPVIEAPADRLIVREDRIFLSPRTRPTIDSQMMARPGLPLGKLRPGRFEPHPALAGALTIEDADHSVSWGLGDKELRSFLRGETVASPGPDGWVLVCFERWGLGWAKRSRGVLKNMLPPQARQIASRWANATA